MDKIKYNNVISELIQIRDKIKKTKNIKTIQYCIDFILNFKYEKLEDLYVPYGRELRYEDINKSPILFEMILPSVVIQSNNEIIKNKLLNIVKPYYYVRPIILFLNNNNIYMNNEIYYKESDNLLFNKNILYNITLKNKYKTYIRKENIIYSSISEKKYTTEEYIKKIYSVPVKIKNKLLKRVIYEKDIIREIQSREYGIRRTKRYIGHTKKYAHFPININNLNEVLLSVSNPPGYSFNFLLHRVFFGINGIKI